MDLVARAHGMRANSASVPARMSAVGLVLGLLFGASVMGCGEHCPIGKTKCVANELWTCPNDPDGPYLWAKRDCGGWICVTAAVPESPGRVRSFCALESEPRSGCSGVLDACDGAEMLFCKDGFVVGAQTCGGEAHCLAGLDSISVCPLNPTPDPRCEAAESEWWASYACDGTKSVECHVDSNTHVQYAVSELDCGSAGCAHGQCGSDGPADARCESAAAAHPEWPVQVTCDNNVALACNGAHLLFQLTCGPMVCVAGSAPGQVGSGGCQYGFSFADQ